MKRLLNKRIVLLSSIIAIFVVSIIACSTGASAQKKPNIYILATGGTIAGAASDKTQVAGYQSGAIGIQTLIDAVPEMKAVAEIKGEQVVSIDSQDMNNDIWMKLSNRINELLSSSAVDGVVITHGTDTLEETAYFMNLTIKSNKPVVLVGSMRPATAMSADGPLNLYNAVKVAASPLSKGRGVLVSMNDQIFASRFVTKGNTTNVATFHAPNQGPIGYMQNGELFYYTSSLRKHTQTSEFSLSGVKSFPRVDIIYAFAGITKDYVDHLVSQGTKGIVVAGMGDGGLGTILKESLAKAAEQGIVVVRSNRTGSGIVVRNGEANDDKLKFVVADDLNPQKARILLQFALLKTHNPVAIQKMFMTY